MDNKIKNLFLTVAEKTETAVNMATGKIIDITEDAKNEIIKQLDKNGNGEIGIDDIISIAVTIPGVHIARDEFLQRELYKNHPQEVIDKAIATTPTAAGVTSDEIDHIADEVIKNERYFVSGISVALGAPGGWAMAATLPADIAQYYAYTLRAVQKLLYLYGFPEVSFDKNGIMLDSETLNSIIVCLGVMNGVAGANNAIKAMAKALAVGVEKQLMNKALTKGTLFPLVKSIMKWFGVNLTKSLFSGAVKKAIPIVGSVIGGGITFFSFKPCCYRLKDALQDTMLSNPSHVSEKEEEIFFKGISSGEIIDAEYEEIPAEELNCEDNIAEQD